MKSVAPFGGVSSVFTPNPLAAGIPTSGDPILLDISASYTTNGLTARLHATRQTASAPVGPGRARQRDRDPARALQRAQGHAAAARRARGGPQGLSRSRCWSKRRPAGSPGTAARIRGRLGRDRVRAGARSRGVRRHRGLRAPDRLARRRLPHAPRRARAASACACPASAACGAIASSKAQGVELFDGIMACSCRGRRSSALRRRRKCDEDAVGHLLAGGHHLERGDRRRRGATRTRGRCDWGPAERTERTELASAQRPHRSLERGLRANRLPAAAGGVRPGVHRPARQPGGDQRHAGRARGQPRGGDGAMDQRERDASRMRGGYVVGASSIVRARQQRRRGRDRGDGGKPERREKTGSDGRGTTPTIAMRYGRSSRASPRIFSGCIADPFQRTESRATRDIEGILLLAPEQGHRPANWPLVLPSWPACTYRYVIPATRAALVESVNRSPNRLGVAQLLCGAMEVDADALRLLASLKEYHALDTLMRYAGSRKLDQRSTRRSSQRNPSWRSNGSRWAAPRRRMSLCWPSERTTASRRFAAALPR